MRPWRVLILIGLVVAMAAPAASADAMRFDVDVKGRQDRSFEATKVGAGRCGVVLRARVQDVLTYSLLVKAARITARGGYVRGPNGQQVRWKSTRVVRMRFVRPRGCPGRRVQAVVRRCTPQSGVQNAGMRSSRIEIRANVLTLPVHSGRFDPFRLRHLAVIPPGAGSGQAVLCRTSLDNPRRRPASPFVTEWYGPRRPTAAPDPRVGPYDRDLLASAEGDATPLIVAIRRGEPRRVIVPGTGVEARGTSVIRHRFRATFAPVPRSFRLRLSGPALANPYTGSSYSSVWEGSACGYTPFGVEWRGTWRALTSRPGAAGVDHGSWTATFPEPGVPVRPVRFISYSGLVEDEPAEVAPGGLPWQLGEHLEHREMRIVERPGLPPEDEGLHAVLAREPVHTNAGDHIGDLVQEGEVTEVPESCAPGP